MSRTRTIQKNAKAFDELRSLWALVGEGSDQGRGPFTVDEACALLDMLDPQVGGDGTGGRSWFEHQRAWARNDAANLDLTQPDDEITRWNTFVRMCAALRTLFGHAVKLAHRDPAMRWDKDAFKLTTAAWLRHGFRMVYDDQGDRHYHCLFCDDNLATFGGGSRTVTARWMTERARHIEPCAMRYLIKTYNLLSPQSNRQPIEASSKENA